MGFALMLFSGGAIASSWESSSGRRLWGGKTGCVHITLGQSVEYELIPNGSPLCTTWLGQGDVTLDARIMAGTAAATDSSQVCLRADYVAPDTTVREIQGCGLGAASLRLLQNKSYSIMPSVTSFKTAPRLLILARVPGTSPPPTPPQLPLQPPPPFPEKGDRYCEIQETRFRQDCQDDKDILCPDDITVDKVMRCLDAQRDELSAGCRVNPYPRPSPHPYPLFLTNLPTILSTTSTPSAKIAVC